MNQPATKIPEYSYNVNQNANYDSFYNKYAKRFLDIVFAVTFFVILIPIYIALSVAIIIDAGFPILYKADRGGYKGRIFKIYKFRTMVKNADKNGGGTTALNDSRITRIGRFLRKTKLDEIAQLINIIKGDMSFVGPRPELTRYTSQYDGLEKYIFEVRPGITDYSSIQFLNLDEIVGSDNADEMYEKYVLPDKNKLRIKYAFTVSLKTDIMLFFRTIFSVFNKAGRYISSQVNSQLRI